MAIFFVLLSGAFVAFSNLMMRRTIDNGGTTKGYLVFKMLTAFVSGVLLEPVRSGNYAWNKSVALLGSIAGTILACMLYFLGKAIEKGPSGLTFSLLASSTVMPTLLMTFLFGAAYGFPYTPWHGIGSFLVIAGIFWAVKGTTGMQDRMQWIVFCTAMFCLHIALLALFQWRSLLLNFPQPQEITMLFTAEQIKSVWFLPFMFLTAGLINFLIFRISEKRSPKKIEFLYGFLGGALNGTGTFFLICATSTATPLKNAVIFPMYSVTIIVLSNLWGQKLYQEQVNWKACQVCILGIIVAMVDWKRLISIFS